MDDKGKGRLSVAPMARNSIYMQKIFLRTTRPLNQIGSLSETIETIELAHQNKFWSIISHRGGGETNDTFMIDLAVATKSEFVKVGISRGERVEKYNRLMEIEDELK